jgi:F0F1-type ATP synthase assembly protein I
MFDGGCGGRPGISMLQRAALKLAIWQVLITALVAVLMGGAGGPGFALSAATGGGIGIVAGLYQALRMFSVDAGRNPDGFIQRVYVSEALKIVVTAALMVVAIKVLHVEMLPFMTGYIAIYFVYWVFLKTGFPGIENPGLNKSN